MEILFAATELAPWAKVGTLADTIASLTKVLRQQGHRVTLALPRYPLFERAGLLLARRLTQMSVKLGDRVITTTVYDGRLASGVDLVLLDMPEFFGREGIYGGGGEDWNDNPLRFAAFSAGVVQLVAQRLANDSPFDIVHAHDWPTALVPMYAKSFPQGALTTPTRYVFTVHNLAYQGIVPASRMAELGVPPEHFHPGGVEFYGSINILKAGAVFADAITTVSDSYAREIQTKELGHGLDGVLASRKDKLRGIVNGIDYSLWNPATDPALVARYDAFDSAGKLRCKLDLLSNLQLGLSGSRPLVALAGRISEQKGTDLFLDALAKLLASDATFVVAGDGDPELVSRLSEACEKWPERLAFLRDPTDMMTHRVIAAADLVLVPSRLEPCGLVQQWAQRYGAVPVAHATGGLVDTIIDCDSDLATGTGMLFDDATVDSLAGAFQRALAGYAGKNWAALRNRIMLADIGLDRCGYRYAQLYAAAISS